MNPAHSSKEKSNIRMGGVKRPILCIVIPFCVGIAFSYFFNISILPFLVLTILFLILCALFFRNNLLSHVFLYIALIFFGIVYYQDYSVLPQNHISNFTSEEGKKVSIKGIIIDDPITKKAFYGKEKTSFILRSNLLIDALSARAVTGLVKVDIYTDEKGKLLQFGDEIIMEGTLSVPGGLRNPGSFNYSTYLKIKNIYVAFVVHGAGSVQIIKRGPSNTLQGRAYLLRHRIRELMTKYVDKPYSGFLNAILIGDRSALESFITDDFVKTGTVHVLAISGLHMGLVAAIFLFFFKILRIPKRYNLALTAIALIFYSFVAGSNPPVIRAAIIFVIFVLGYLIRRESDLLNSLSIAAFLILLSNPKELFDPSFQLSFASVSSIILFAPKIEERLKFKPAYLSKSISVSIAATVGVLPIVAKYFNIISPIAIIANLIIIPALFVIISASFVFLFLNFLGAAFLSSSLGDLLSSLSHITFYINHLFSKVPFSYLRASAPSLLFLILYYLALFALFFMRRKKYLLVWLLLTANIVVWSDDLSPDRKLLRVTFLDVGKGDSFLVQFPNSGAILVDGGLGGIRAAADMGKNVVAPYLWNNGVKKLDAIIITHFHEDHLGGLLYILNNFDVGCVIDNGAVPTEDRTLYDEYKNIIRRKSIRRIVVGAGDEVTGFGGAKIFVINPDKEEDIVDSNDNSIVFKLEYKDFSILSCADISSKVMGRLMSYGEFLKSDVVKIPHHGGYIGEENAAKEFFKEVAPKVSVISTGGKYRFFAASKRTRGLLDSLQSDIYETKKSGAIRIITNGSKFEIKETSGKN